MRRKFPTTCQELIYYRHDYEEHIGKCRPEQQKNSDREQDYLNG